MNRRQDPISFTIGVVRMWVDVNSPGLAIRLPLRSQSGSRLDPLQSGRDFKLQRVSCWKLAFS